MSAAGTNILTTLALGMADGVVAHAGEAGHAGRAGAAMAQVALPEWVLLIPFLPLLGVVLVTLCAILGVKNKLPAFLTVGCLAAAFAATLGMYVQVAGGLGGGGPAQFGIVKAWDWITFVFDAGDGPASARALVANFSFYIDSLTCLWMLFVTGLGAIIALYASEYMSHDVGLGYCRFFVAFNLFVFSMACLVMGDNLLLLFLGWEGVGLCSYLLIGYFYKKPVAVAAAKKAFIVNRIGDLGLSMGVMLAFVVFGSVEYTEIFRQVDADRLATGETLSSHWASWLIPALLTIGAFGKSAQLFFYVWLPDAMEGPTPVSALIHAATMVTAGVFLIARMYPLYLADPDLIMLTLVSWCGAITALWSGLIAMGHFDIKRIMGYSTVSQLGYMFAGLGVLTSTGGVFHVFTHAFFKATLFLACGAVMHGFGGQLDLRKLSGVRKMKGWGLVGIAMLVGSLNLSGFPLLAGYWSKDMILAEAFVQRPAVGWILLLTAGLTAYYTFRAYLRVFEGPMHFEPGEDAHGGHDEQSGHGHGHGQVHGHGHAKGHDHVDHGHGAGHAGSGEFHPHAPGWAINTVLGLLVLGCFAIIPLAFMGEHGGWVGSMVSKSTAGGHAGGAGHAHGSFLGMDPHKVMYYVSAVVGIAGILTAMVLHGPRGLASLGLGNRERASLAPRAESLAALLGPIATLVRGKFYVDEVYDFLIVKPLWVLGHILRLIDNLLVDGLVNAAGWIPRGVGSLARRTQSGVLHDYALRMAAGLALIVVVILAVRSGWLGGGSGGVGGLWR